MMKMKIWMYAGFFVIFIFIFTQIALPLSSRVKNLEIVSAESSVPAFNDIKDNAGTQNTKYQYFAEDKTIDEIGNHHFVNYQIEVESTMLITGKVISSKIIAADKYKDRIIARVVEPSSNEVSAVKKASKNFKLLVDTTGMSKEEITEMIRNIDIQITWEMLPGWERVNRVYIPDKTTAINF